MSDLGFSGPKFTWTNKRDVDDLIQCRLDRCWANPGWNNFFDEANVTHLARVNSDYCPLLLKLKPSKRKDQCNLFKFQSIWLSHNDFPDIVREAQSRQEVNLVDAKSMFVTKAKEWNREIFGNVFAKKKRLMARLVGIQKAMANRPCTFLINLQNQLSDEYNNILHLEEKLWAMKARTNWIINGEQNTSYFHLSTIVRRSKNRITNIQNAHGEWVHNTGEVKRIFVEYFHKLYQFEQIYCPLSLDWNSDQCASLAEEEALALTQPPSDVEIWDALKSMKPFKAPGIDGIHSGFFQRLWLLVEDSVKREVKEIFTTQKIPEYLNQTLIALIPKQISPELVSHYRPISCCTTIYKIVTKILVLRLKPLLPSLISPMQSAFIVGRRDSDCHHHPRTYSFLEEQKRERGVHDGKN